MSRAKLLASLGLTKWQHYVALVLGACLVGFVVGYVMNLPEPVEAHQSADATAPIPTTRLDGPQTSLAVGDMALTLAVSPQPVRVMTEQGFTVTLTEGDQPITDAQVQVDLTMLAMYMGDNRVNLTHAGDGRYTGTGVFPVCSSGHKEWLATVAIQRADVTKQAAFQLTVDR